MTHVIADLRYAVRTLRRVPVFTTIAVLSIAFGIAANTAVFTLVDQVVLRGCRCRVRASWCSSAPAAPRAMAERIGRRHRARRTPCTRDLRDHNTVFAGMFCRLPFPPAHHARRAQRAGDRRARVWQLFPDARREARPGQTLHRRRRARERRAPGGGARVQLLEVPFQWRPCGNRPHDRRQRSPARNHRRRRCGVPGYGHRPAGQVCTCPSRCSRRWDRRGCSSRAAGSGGCRYSPACATALTAERAQAGIQPLYRSLLEQEATRRRVSCGLSRHASGSSLPGRAHRRRRLPRSFRSPRFCHRAH